MILSPRIETTAFETENSYSTSIQRCNTCKYYYKVPDCFPIEEPCGSCVEFKSWDSHIDEEVRFDIRKQTDEYDAVNSPGHYCSHPSGVECIQVTEHMDFCLGNVIKYIWRANLKENKIEDLKKAVWYLNREISKLEKGEATNAKAYSKNNDDCCRSKDSDGTDGNKHS